MEADAASSLHRMGARHIWGANNMRIVAADGEQGIIEVVYPQGSINPGNKAAPAGGAGFQYAKARRTSQLITQACLAYEVRFAENFDFVRGGKLPGLYGGDAPSGGDSVKGENGFSMRYMWRAHGDGEVYAYVANKNNDSYGESIGRGMWRFIPGRWHHLEQEVVLNQIGRSDGILRVWVDGTAVIDRHDILYRTHESPGIDGLMFSTFFGGHDASWATPKTQTVQFKGFVFRADEQ